jgi:hypothetical protein
MLEYIQNISFTINMSDTTIQNLIYALSMIHSVTIINQFVFFPGNHFFNYSNASKRIMFPKLVEYIPSTIITKEVYYHIHNIYKFIKSGEF